MEVKDNLKPWVIGLALVVLIVAILVMAGWQFDVEFLKTPISGLVSMNPVTALLFIILSIAFLVLKWRHVALRNIPAIKFLLWSVILIALARLLGYVWPSFVQVDQLLYRQSLIHANTLSGGMAPNTAVNFVLQAGAILLLLRNEKGARIGQYIVGASQVLTLFALLGYFFTVPEFMGLLPYFPMAVHTAVCFFLMGIAILLVRRPGTLSFYLTDDLEGNALARWLLPVAAVIPVATSFMLLRLFSAFQYSVEFGLTVIVIVNIIAYSAIIRSLTQRLNKRDRARMQMEQERALLNKELQAANEELATQNEELTAANEELHTLNEQLSAAGDKIREQADIIVRQKDEQLNNALESMNAIIWSVDLTGSEQSYLSRSVNRFTDTPMDELLSNPQSWIDNVHPDDRHLREKAHETLYQKGYAEATFRIFDKHKAERWISVQYVLIRDQVGNPQRAEGIAIDVTQSRAQELAIQRYRENLEVIFTNTVEEILLLDAEGKVIMYNQAFEKFITWATGKPPAVGGYVWDTTVSERSQASKQLLARALAGETVTLDAAIRAHGTEVIHELRYQPVFIGGVAKYVTIISIDVTERKKRERLLNDFQQAVYRSSIVSRADRKGIITYVNDRFVEISGYSEKELVGSNHRIINSGFHPKGFWVDMWKTISAGHIWREEVKNRAKDGSYYWVDTFIMPFVDEKGNVLEFLSIRNDISKRKRAEEELMHSKYLLDKANEVSKIGYWTYDLKLNKSVWNERTKIIFGLKDNEVGGFEFYLDMVHPDDREMVKEAALRTLQGLEDYNIDHRIVRNDGSVKWIHEEAQMVKSDAGDLLHLIGVVQDITERKLTEEILREYNERYEILSMATNDAIWDWDIQHDIEVWNHGLTTIFGYTEEDARTMKRFWLGKINPEDFDHVLAQLHDCFDKQLTNFTCTYRFQCADGRFKHVLNRAYIGYQSGKPVRMTGAVQDINDRVEFERQLRSLNERFEIVLDTTGDAIWDWDLANNQVEWGDGLAKLFGYSLTGPVDASFWLDRVHPDDRTRTEQHILEIINDAEKMKWVDEYRFRKNDGTYAFVADRGSVIRDKNGKATRMVGAMQDTTRQRQFVSEIERLSLVASSTENTVVITDAGGRIEWVNNAFVELTGYSLDEVIGRKPGDFLQGPETNKDTTRRISANLKRGVAISEELVNYAKSGHKYWLKINISPVFDSDGQLRNFISIQSDISKQKEFENQITNIARELTTLIENANVPIFGVDKNGLINEWNHVSNDLLEYTKSEMLGREWLHLFDRKLHDKFRSVIKKAMSGASTSNYELPVVTKSNKLVILLISVSPRRDVNKNIVGAICVGQDLTEVIRYRQGLERMVDERTRELNVALQKEKELVEMKSKFVSIASHEFRTPLTTISIASGFIKKYKHKLNPDDIDQKLTNIDKQVDHMTHLLDDVLMIGKSEAGKIMINVEPVDLDELIRQLVSEVEQSTRKSHHVAFSFETRHHTFNTDEKLIRNIVINILTNAIKFSPGKDQVRLTVDDQLELLRIQVKDEGLGIPDDDMKNLFGSFYRASNVTSIQGTGLGLSIVKKAVELLHGSIKVDSKLNEGTTVTIILPNLSPAQQTTNQTP